MTLFCKYIIEQFRPQNCQRLGEGNETNSLSTKHQVLQDVTTPNFKEVKDNDGSLEVKDKDSPKKHPSIAKKAKIELGLSFCRRIGKIL